MKRILFVVVLFLVFACSKEAGYKIKVDLKGAQGMVFLEQRDTGEWIPVDSAVFSEEKAVMRGSVDIPEMYYLSLNGDRNKLTLFIENSDITVTGTVDSIANATISGSSVHDEYHTVVEKIQRLSDEYVALYQESRQLRAEGNTRKADELMDQVNRMYESVGTIQEDFIKNNPASYATPAFLANIQYEKSLEELEAMLNNLDPRLNETSIIQLLRERVAKLRTVAVGQKAPDFTLNDPEGNPITLSEVYKNNAYTLLDFWAGWCGPCRVENPNVVAVYNDYKNKGFGVLGISLDRTKEEWVQAIADDGLTWQQVSDLSYWNSAAANLYAVNSIPSNLILDREGIIIAKNLRGQDLRNKISGLLDE